MERKGAQKRLKETHELYTIYYDCNGNYCDPDEEVYDIDDDEDSYGGSQSEAEECRCIDPEDCRCDDE